MAQAKKASKKAAKKAATKKTASTEIIIPKPRFEEAELTLMGVSQLCTHKWSEKAIKMLRDKQMGKAVSKKEPKDPVAEFNGARYRMEDGADAFRADGIKMATVDACSFVAGITKVSVKGAMFVNLGEELVPIMRRDGRVYGIDVEPRNEEHLVRVNSKGPGTGTADLRYRPFYDDWAIPIRVRYMANILTLEQIVNLMSIGGFSIGIGEGRPQLKGGQWGMYEVAAGAIERKRGRKAA